MNIKHLVITMMLALGGIATMFAQTSVSGMLVDEETNEPLIGATVQVKGDPAQGTATDYDGSFTLKVKQQGATLEFKYIGYESQSVKVPAGKKADLGTIAMKSDSKVLSDVIVTSQIAIQRRTPVAVSNVSFEQIDEKLGMQEFPEILKTTPGVHAQKDGGGFGDSEIYMRGFANENIGVMVNGVPMNDMEWGGIYWSNWTGLTDVTTVMQTQRGMGASKVSIPSLGGTINIITSGIEQKRGGTAYYQLGNDGYNKILFKASTGLMPHDWSVTLLGSRTWGDGYVQGADFEGYTWFANVSKRFGDNHQLSFTAFGSPQEHYQRQGRMTIADWQMAEKVYGIKNYKYNASYGFDNNGERRSSEYNFYHKPQLSLNHQWKINEKSSLSTVFYVSLGRGGGYSGQGNEDFGYSYTDWRATNYGELQMKYRKPDGTFDYGAIQDINAASENGSMLVMSESRNNHNWYGLISTYSTKFGNYFDFYGGIDFRYYKGVHTNEIIDLYGGDYFVDSTRGKVKASDNAMANDPNWRYEKLGVGDVVYRDYDGHVMQYGAFFQTEYNKDNLSAFVAGSLSNSAYWRYDRFYYDEAHAKSKTKSFMGFTVKGGANYNFDKHNNVFANVGYISRAPKFSGGVFLSSTQSNTINNDARNEKVFSVEAGYGFRNSWFTANVNAYWTRWMDKTMTDNGTLGNAHTEYFVNMTGVNARNMGIEVDLKIRPTNWLEIWAMASIGDWIWTDNATGYAFDYNGTPLNKEGKPTTMGAPDHVKATVEIDGIHQGGSAQNTFGAGATFKINKALRVGFDWTYYGSNYAYYDLGDVLSAGDVVKVYDPWKIPAASTVDLNASYRFKVGGLDAVLSGNVNNLFDYQYISKAWNPNNSKVEATQDNIYCYYAFGRTYSMKLRINF